ncbi:MAG TPA: hypothetical protein PKD55_04420 [Bellilinea sp.]|nr:hypothetical protein [Bellilinea sp.]
MRRQNYFLFSYILGILTILYIGYVGVKSILYLTEVGPWAFSDSAAYITVAKNIVAGRGVVLQNPSGVYELFPLHTPFYPILTAGIMRFGLTAIEASRWLNAVLFGLVIALAGLGTLGFTRSPLLGTGVAYLISRSIETQKAFSGMMSEGVFLFFTILTLVLITLAISTSKNKPWLILAGLSAGLAVLSRYAGLAVVGSGLLLILLFSMKKWKSRLADTALFGVPALIVALLWLAPVYLSTRTFGDRPLGTPIDLGSQLTTYFNSFIEIFSGWLPYFQRGNHILAPEMKLGITFGLIIALLVFVFACKSRSRMKVWLGSLTLFFIAYLLLHLTSFVTAETQPDINGRLLLPLLITFYLMLPALLFAVFKQLKAPLVGKILFVVFVAVTTNYYAGKLHEFTTELHGYGNGYTSFRWKDNALFDAVKEIPPGVPLISNEPGMVLFYTERFPHQLPLYDLDTAPKFDPNSSAYVLFQTPTDPNETDLLDKRILDLRNTHNLNFENKDGSIFLPKE